MNKISITLEKSRMMPAGQTTDDWDVLTIQNLIFEPLVRCRNGQISPALAKSWMIFDGGKRWVFYLRENACFSDGSFCTMDDVYRSIEDMRNAKDSFGMQGPFSRYLTGLELIVLDSLTLEIRSDRPNGDVADFLCEIFIRKQSASGDTFIGTGIYELSDYIPNQKLSLRKRKDLFLSADVCDMLDFLIVPNCEDRFAMLKADVVQVSMDLEQMDKVPFEDNGVIWHKTINTLSVIGFLNCFSAPFNSRDARLAINLAVDVKSLIHDVMHDLAVPSSTIVSPFHCGFESDLSAVPYDPERAKALFARADMPDKLILRTPTHMPERAAEVADFIADQLRKINIIVEVDIAQDRPKYAREVGKRQTGHIALFDSSPHSSYRVLFDKISSKQQGLWWQGLSDSELDEMILNAHETCDTKYRELNYAKAIRYLHNNPSWLYLYHPILVTACNPSIKNIEITHEGLLHFAGTW